MEDIPLSQPDITELEIDAVIGVLRGPRLSLGPKMEEFETTLAAYIGVPHAVAVSSGTAGLHLCLLAMGIGDGDEVIVPSFTFIAAANAIRYVRATPVFIDVEAASLNLEPALIEQAITPRTRAIMVVHTFGYPADMDRILEIAQRNDLRVIEDACEAIGAEYQGRRVGSFGDAGVFAFYPNKQITTGEGGMVVTRDEHLAREVRALRNQGRYESDEWHQHSLLGYNYRLSEINAALGCAQMERIESILSRREMCARRYDELLRNNVALVLPQPTLQFGRISWFVYVVRLASGLANPERDRVIHTMRDNGIQCGRYFAPIHSQPAYAMYPPRSSLPVTESESRQTIALPFFTTLSEKKIDQVCETLVRAIPS